MTFDEMYDEMVHHEMARNETAHPETAHPETVHQETVHDEFRSTPRAGTSRRGAHAASPPSRARTITLVATGGVACAVVGALLGGLGGEFGVTPATAHAIGSSRFVPLAQSAGVAFIERAPTASVHSAHSTGGQVSHDGVAATFASLGGVLGGIASGAGTPVDTSVGGIGGGIGTGSGGGATSGVPSPTGAAPTDPVTGLVETLDNVVAGLTSTLDGLGGLLPLPSIPGPVTVPVLAAAAPIPGVPAAAVSALGAAPATSATPAKSAAPAKTAAPVTVAAPVKASVPAASGSASAPSGSVPASSSSASTLTSPVSTVTSTVSGVVSTLPTTTALPGVPSVPVPVTVPTTIVGTGSAASL
jgi:trimeric autotransporter adhesin